MSTRVARVVVDDDDVYEWNSFKLVKSKAKRANERTNEKNLLRDWLWSHYNNTYAEKCVYLCECVCVCACMVWL